MRELSVRILLCSSLLTTLMGLALVSPPGAMAQHAPDSLRAAAPDTPGIAFPRPPEIEPLVSFWMEIFTKYDKDQTILHDEDDPQIRYETLTTQGMSESERRDVVRKRKLHYVKILEGLALTPRARWDDEQKRNASLFPPETGIGKFLEAAGRVHSQRGVADQFREGLIRSGRWKETIKGIFQGYGIPQELAALPHVESSYNPDAFSKAGAAGVWQFTSRTGRRFMRIDRCVDERRDVYISSHAAARYLSDAYEKLGSWPLTVTSYNHGVDGMMRARRELGTTDISRLIREYDGPYFGFASKNFYAEFLAALEISSNSAAYFGHLPVATPEAVERYVLPGPARFAALALALGISADELKSLNPALTTVVTEGRLAVPSGVVLNVPSGRVPDLAIAYSRLPATDRRGRTEERDYQVRSGDTLITIARAHGVSVSDLQTANDLGNRTVIIAGQRLTIPAAMR